MQFNSYLQFKVNTQVVKGGNTEEFYSKEGTLPKSKMLCNVYPNISKIVWKFNRWHHYVNYRYFNHKLIRKDNLKIKTNNYKLKLIKK